LKVQTRYIYDDMTSNERKTQVQIYKTAKERKQTTQ